MTGGETSGAVDQIIAALRERAKELHCLYNVHGLLARTDASLADICRGLLTLIPPGWQYPDACFARITLEGAVYEPPGALATAWVQRAEVVVKGAPAGVVEVFYTRPMPDADEGPFLKEERKLIDTIAERLAETVARRRPQPQGAAAVPATRPGEWRVIVDFLRRTDHQLVTRLARRMVNYLAWNGVMEAQTLLQRVSGTPFDAEPGETNRPTERTSPLAGAAGIEEAFTIAAAHLGEDEIVAALEKWIKDDKAGFLIEAVEHQHTSLGEIADALERYEHFAAQDRELSRAVQIGLRVSLVRRLLTEDLDFINIAKNYLEVDDFHDVVRHTVTPAASHGKLGGKSSRLLLAYQVVRKSREYADTLGAVRVPKTWYVTSDALLRFLEHNHLDDIHNRKYLEIEQIRREYSHLVQVFKHSGFPADVVHGLSMALDDFGDRPLIVRSSSLLEDRMGAAFSGKYKSLFLANQGTKRERLAALLDAIAEVYASVFGADPIAYRATHGLLDFHEEMGVLMQEVVGGRVGPYHLPMYAGVAFSNNEFRWSPRIRRGDGLIRLVPGLGTRAVDRLSDDYPILIAPGQPGLRVNVTPDEIARYSPRRVDVINLETRQFETVAIDDLLRAHGRDFPQARLVLSLADDGGHYRPAPFDWDPARSRPVVTFEGLLTQTPFLPTVQALLQLLRERLGGPVDVEFASDGREFYLLQCRPQSFTDEDAPSAIPRDVPPDRVVFTAHRYVSNGRVPDLTHIVYVDADAYAALGTLDELRAVGRVVGRLNKLLPKRQFVLMGPGRWGSRGDIRLGVNVGYADINNCALLMEIAAPRGGSVPELSFGTHFFQDLVESSIRYLPLFPGTSDVVFNEAFLRQAPNVLRDLLPEQADLAGPVRVIDVPAASGGSVLRVLMNADLEEAIGFLAAPGQAPAVRPAPASASEASRLLAPAREDHWRWRLQMAERIAAAADPDRFGIKAMYVFGSTKNATAGAASDIDLLVHVGGTEDQQSALRLWLEGWSLSLSEMNFLRTGHRADGLLDVHIVTDEDIARQTSYAAKIGAATDPARPLAMGRGGALS
jgi:hypothetical protein